MASSALVVADASAAAIITASGFDRAQVELVKSTVAVGATDMELALFLQTAKHRGLDPFTRQIHFVKRKSSRKNARNEWEDVWTGTMQTGIDGFRLIADRTGKYDGQDEPEFEYEDGGKVLRRATVRVYRKDIGRPFVGTAYWKEYAEFDSNGAPRAMWKRMPHVMLSKCAESIALRKAFPENLSGLYSDDEMPTIEGDVVVHEQQAPRPTGTVTQLRAPDEAKQRVEAPPADVTPAGATTDEIPPAGSDAATLRAWLGRRLAIAAKSWTGEHMAIACAEVNQALALPSGTVTPRTLSSHLAAYRDAIAGTGAPVGEPSNMSQAEIADRRSGGESSELEALRAEMVALMAEHTIADDDPDLQDACGRITDVSESGVRYGWKTLDALELRDLLAEMRTWNFGGADEIPL